jgi:hypothetical protein
MVPEEGVEPTRSKAPADFESAASASSATPGLLANLTRHAAPLKHLQAVLARRQRHLPLPMGSATLLAALEPFSEWPN